jgi:MYXO-CTERM domain-containing protein
MALTIARSAPAYNYGSPVGDPCHETMTADALRRLRTELSTAAPLPSSGSDELAMDDLPFELPYDMRDIGAVALLIGVRDNDLKGHSGIDTQELAGVHGEDEDQPEHCLRRSVHDDASGSEQAAAECRDFVRDRVLQGIDHGLDADGQVNPSKRSTLLVNLAFRGRTELDLPTFYLRLGQALHTLQDSFSHTFRTPDHRQMTVALNWVDVVEGNHDPARDGPAHMRALDLCRNLDDFRRARLAVANEATEAVMRAALDPDLSSNAKRAAVDAALADYMGFSAGCTAENDWCSATERRYADSACACRTSAPAPTGSGWWALLLGMGVFAWRRRARQVAAAGLVLSTAATAQAHDDREHQNARRGFGLHSSFAASLDHGGFAWAVGGRYAVADHWLFGLDAEYNPWFSIEARRIARGAFNGYGTVIYRHAIGSGFTLRFTVNAGVSVLLFDLVGAPQGSAGPFLGASLLGLSYSLGEDVDLVLDPAQVVLPVPQIQGAPFSYHQYRLSIGIQIGA